ncbi:hypothetical protein [Priestia megaterium]
MNWKSLLVNIIIIGLLAIAPTLLGESLKKPVSIIYLVSIIILSAIIQILLGESQKNLDKALQLEEESDKLEKKYNSSILNLKAKGISYFDVAIYPLFYHTPRCNQDYGVRIFVNSRDELVNSPEITLTLDKNVEVKKANTSIHRYFHNEKHYFLLNQTIDRSEGSMYYEYEFKITFKEQGENKFKLLVESKELSSEIENSFFVQ